MKRRELLKAWTGVLALPAMAALPAAAATKPFAWSRKSAKALVGQTFWLLHPERRALALVLKNVEPAKEKHAGIDAFSLYFDSSVNGLTSATYEWDHPTTGLFSLYISAVAAGPRNKRFRADFSLLA